MRKILIFNIILSLKDLSYKDPINKIKDFNFNSITSIRLAIINLYHLFATYLLNWLIFGFPFSKGHHHLIFVLQLQERKICLANDYKILFDTQMLYSWM
jgi:hypothetical protein